MPEWRDVFWILDSAHRGCFRNADSVSTTVVVAIGLNEGWESEGYERTTVMQPGDGQTVEVEVRLRDIA
jgi:hypothetical protein